MKRFTIEKKNVQSFLAGVLISSTLLSTGALAGTYKEQLNAVYNDIKLIVNGVRIVPKDINGVRVDPFVVKGTTYVPVRAISQALGEPVEWDGETNSVIIGTKKTEDGNVGITELVKSRPNYYTGSYPATISDEDSFEVLQEMYSGENSIRDGYVDLLLKGDYKKLTGKLSIPDNAYSSGGYVRGGYLRIVADGEEVFNERIFYGDEIVPIDIDLIGVEKLQIDINSHYQINGVVRNYAMFSNVEFEPIDK